MKVLGRNVKARNMWLVLLYPAEMLQIVGAIDESMGRCRNDRPKRLCSRCRMLAKVASALEAIEFP